MPIGLSVEHEDFRHAVRRWCTDHCSREVVRAVVDAAPGAVRSFWDELAKTDWIGLAVPQSLGGAGYGSLELAIVLEELGRNLAPGPVAASSLAAELLVRFSSEKRRRELVPRIVGGELPATVALDEGGIAGEWRGSDLVLRGTLQPLVGGSVAALFLIGARTDTGTVWLVLERSHATIRGLNSIDPTRDVVEIALDECLVRSEDLLPGLDTEMVRQRAASLYSAEAAGVARACLDATVEYAKTRCQFGQPIGQFQAVKHTAVEMLLDVERAVAVAWNAAQAMDAGDEYQMALSAQLAGALSARSACTCAKQNVQMHGAVGFTWEDDAHLFLKRALSIHQLLGGHAAWQQGVAKRALAGDRRRPRMPAPLSAEQDREAIDRVINDLGHLNAEERYQRLAETGLLAPQWPSPWGRGATAVEQLVAEAALRDAGIEQPFLEHIAFVVPLLISYATDEQKERWLWPTIRKEVSWCQMFSEPDAGSDLAALSTKAIKVGGGWNISGHKIWTTRAHTAQLAVCLARTDSAAPMRAGITCFAIDMSSRGVEIRPIIEITGRHHFNEVFLSDVFVPDENVIGGVGKGWTVARATMVHERVSMGTASPLGDVTERLIELVRSRPDHDSALLERLGGLLEESHVTSIMTERSAFRAVAGAEPGPESSLLKLARNEHEQRLAEFGLELLGTKGTISDGEGADWIFRVLYSRCLTIAGGTSQIHRNVIGERLLGLARDRLASR